MWSTDDLLVPVPRRRSVALLAVSAGIVAVLLGLVYAGDGTAGWLDRRLDPVARSALQIELFTKHDSFYLRLGDRDRLPILLAVVAAVVAVARRWSGVGLVVLGPIVAVLLAEFVAAPLVDRTFNTDPQSYPSGHATSVAATAVALLIVLSRTRRPASTVRRIGRILSRVLVVVVAAVSGFALAAESTHYSTDVIGGWCTAIAVVCALALLIDLGVSRVQAYRTARSQVSRSA